MTEDQKKLINKLKLNLYLNRDTSFIAGLLSSITINFDLNANYLAKTNGECITLGKLFNTVNFRIQTFILAHELWHVAKMHALRMPNKNDPETWNIACDIHINNILYIKSNLGLSTKDQKVLVNDIKMAYNSNYSDLSEEEIYNKIKTNKNNTTNNSSFGNDLVPNSNDKKASQKVALALSNLINQANMIKSCGNIPDDLVKLVKNTLNPKLKWEYLLRKFLKEALDKTEWSWRRPNKRFSDIYLPSLIEEENKLTKLAYFLDTSGSIGEPELKAFNAELKYIFTKLKPDQIDVYQFDTEIKKHEVFTQESQFKEIKLVGGGGTSYKDVHDTIVKLKPVCAVIFTDLYASPMEKINNIPIIWVNIDPSNGLKGSCGITIEYTK